ncbi:hypothetical protein ACFY7C_35620 [Streptomyces sp. NPDC012769]|uniref:hypothetical protein n=1 Tax=Streptomyces sp. NPDC012769 TaxID=3364848 RepID=UPI0036906D94
MYGPARVRARTRGALAVATAVGITTGLATALSTTPAVAADTPAASDEVVIRDPGRFKPRNDTLYQAGTTGYVHRQEGTTGTLWTDAATGETRTIPAYAEAGHSGLSADWRNGGVTVTDLATGKETLLTLPAQRFWADGFTADTVLAGTIRPDTNTKVQAYWLISSENGTPVERPVTGLPEAGANLYVDIQDSRGAILLDDATAYYLDYAGATLTRLSDRIGAASHYRLSGEHIVAWNSRSGVVRTVPRSTPAAEPVTTTVVGSEAGPVAMDFTVSGNWVIAATEPIVWKAPHVLGEKLLAVPLGGGPAKELLPAATATVRVAPDGSVLAVGGTGSTDWAVRRITPDGDGLPVLSTVRKVPHVPAAYTGLALGAGRLSYVSDSWAGNNPALYDVDTDLTGTPSASAPRLRHRMLATEHGVQSELRSLGDGDSVLVGPHHETLISPTDTSSFRAVTPPTRPGKTDAAGRYVVTQGDGGSYHVMDLDSGQGTGLAYTVNSAASVWGDRVWKLAAATGDKVNTYDLKTRTTTNPVDLGSGCRPSELQAVGRWVYWACGTTKAGVYDQIWQKSVPVPTGEALLGDGFVVRHVGDKLQLTNTTSGVTSDFAALPGAPTGSGRNTTWTVDKFGGGVAYIGAGNDIHVKRVGLVPDGLAPIDHTVPELVFDGEGAEPTATWSPVWRYSRPVGSWQLRVLKGNGEVVRTFEGAQGVNASVRVTWDGKDAQGRGIEPGQYRWELLARPLGGGDGSIDGQAGAFDVVGSSLTTLPGTYTPVTPTRLMNTLAGTGVRQGKVGPRGTVALKVAGQAGVPTEGLTAVVLNVTATNPTANGYVSVYPHDTRRTPTSNLNFTAGQSVANLVTVPVVDGWVEVYNHAGSVDLLADIAGYYTEGTSGAEYQPVAPKRILNTIGGVGAPKAKVGPKGTVTLTIDEPGVSAVAMNVTATNPTATSYVSVYPYGTARPPVSNLNFTAGKSVPNLVIVPVKDGKVTLYNHAGNVDLLADVTGYFKDGTGSVFTGMQPKRILNTIAGEGAPRGKVGAGRTVTLEVGTKYSAVVLNVTATNPTATSYVSVYPYGTARPPVSNLNFTAGQSVPNLVIVPVKDGKITFYNHAGSVDLLADIAGYYTG